MGKEFDVSQGYEFASHLGFVADAAAHRAALSAAHRIIGVIVGRIIPAEPRQPVDRGAYRAGWRANKRPYGADITNTMPYAAIIEHGARAGNIKIGKAMIKALTEWVIRKKLALGSGGEKRSRESQAQSVAWAIAISMQKRGIFNGGKGLKILQRAMKEAPEIFQEEFVKEVARGG